MLSSTSVPESSLLQTASLPPTSLARSRIPFKPSCPVSPSPLRSFGSMPFRHPGPATEATVRRIGFPLRFAAPSRAGKHCATLRPQSGRLRPAGWDGGSAVCLPPPSQRGQNSGWCLQPGVLLRESLSPKQSHWSRRWMYATLCTASRPSAIA
jgi:hypothetical protein